jgi:hypothetical protein
VGGQAASAVVTLGERASRSLTWSRCLRGTRLSRSVPPWPLPGARAAPAVAALGSGKEMAEHARGTVDTGVAGVLV